MAPGDRADERDGGYSRIDPLLELIENRRNRDILRFLFDHASANVDLSTLAQFIERRESAARTGRGDERRKRIATELHHCRLPELSEAQIIEYDPRSRTVVSRPPARVERAFHDLLRVVEQFPRNHNRDSVHSS